MPKNNENKLSSPFWRLIANDLSLQIILDIVAVIVYSLLFSLVNEKTALIATTVVFAPLYCYMLYTLFWGTAERENNIVKYGYMKEDLRRGLKAGLYSAIPLLIFAVVTLAAGLREGADSDMIGYFKMVLAPFVGLITPLVKTSVWLILPFVLIQPVCAALGYHNGHRLYRIFDHLIYEDGIKNNSRNKNQPKRRR